MGVRTSGNIPEPGFRLVWQIDGMGWASVLPRKSLTGEQHARLVMLETRRAGCVHGHRLFLVTDWTWQRTSLERRLVMAVLKMVTGPCILFLGNALAVSVSITITLLRVKLPGSSTTPWLAYQLIPIVSASGSNCTYDSWYAYHSLSSSKLDVRLKLLGMALYRLGKIIHKHRQDSMNPREMQ